MKNQIVLDSYDTLSFFVFPSPLQTAGAAGLSERDSSAASGCGAQAPSAAAAWSSPSPGRLLCRQDVFELCPEVLELPGSLEAFLTSVEALEIGEASGQRAEARA